LNLRGRKWQEAGEDCIMRSFITCTLQFYGDQIKEDEVDDACSRRREKHTIIWLQSLKRGDHLEDLGVDGKIILGCILKIKGEKLWIGRIWLRIGTNGKLL
jgi:hypothetical protein